MQAFVSVNPVKHLANALRGLMHGEPDMASWLCVLIATAIITAVFAPIALRMYHKER